MRARGLHSRLLSVLAAFTACTALLFAAMAFAFLWAVEDAYLSQRLDEEVARQTVARARDGRWAPPIDETIRLVNAGEALPPDLAAALRDEPERVEFTAADGRHYHLRRLLAEDDVTDAGHAWLLLDATSRLVVREWRGGILSTFAIIGTALVGLAMLMAHRVARRTTGPLECLAAEIAATDPGNPPAALATAGRGAPELDDVAKGFDVLLARVGDLLRREREFSRDASHELRTPLAALRSASEQIATHPRAPEDLRDTGRHMAQSARALGRTVETLLALSGGVTPSAAAAPCRLRPVLERVLVDLALLRDDAGLAFDIEVDADARVALPQDVLGLLLANLIANACRHAAGGRLRIETEGAWLRLGNEIPPSPSAERTADRSGFGLAIAHRLCEQHGVALRVVIDGHRAEVALALASPVA